MPRPLASLLAAPAFARFACVVLTFCFWGSGLAKLADFEGAKAEMAFFGFHPPAIVAALVIAVELVGSAFVILNRAAWLGAGMLATFTGLTILLVHDFWNMTGPAATEHFYTATEHVTVIGAMMVVAILSHIQSAVIQMPPMPERVATA